MAARRRLTFVRPEIERVPPTPQQRTRRLLQLSVITVCLTAIVLAIAIPALRPSDRSATAPTFAGRPVVAIVGDASAAALATGDASGDRLGAGLSATVVTRSDPQAAFCTASTAPQDGSGTAMVRLAAQVPRSAAMVVLTAHTTPSGTRKALTAQVLQAVHAARQHAPRARLALLIPGVGSTSIRGALRDAAARAGVTLLDPIALGWLQRAGLVRPDGVTLTRAGRHALIAALRHVVRTYLRSIGAIPTSTPPSTVATPAATSSPTASEPTAAPSASAQSGATSPSQSSEATSATPGDPSTSASASPTSAPASAPTSESPAPSSAPSSSSSTISAIPAGSTAYFFGDSWTHGETATRLRGFPYSVSSHFGWTPVVNGASGSGYVHNAIASASTFPVRATSATSAERPGLIVVEGGLNDKSGDLSQLQAAARLTWQRLQARFPGTPMVIVGPASPTLPVPARLTQVDTLLRQAASDAGLPYISPLEEHWFTAGNVGALINPSTLHPDDAGHTYYASRLDEDLSTLMN